MQFIRRLLVVMIWSTGIIASVMTSFYTATITKTTGGTGDGIVWGAFLPAILVFCVIILVTYILYRIVNYVFGVPIKPNSDQ